MINTSAMKWNNLYAGPLKEVFAAMEHAFRQAGVDYYIIGAQARDVWYARAGKRFRDTKDLDLAVLVGSNDEYFRVKQYLVDHNEFHPLRENYFALRTPSGIIVDILPFGGVDFENPFDTSTTAVTSLPINALDEVFRHGTVTVDGEQGHSFKVATLPSIVLLKLIAFDDRPEHRQKDAGDIAHIISQYASFERDFIYEYHNDLFDPDRAPVLWSDDGELGAIVIGREVSRIIQDNKGLQQRVRKILTDFISQHSNSAFVREMSRVTEHTIATILEWLMKMERGFENTYKAG
jgi:predicted nucleotidyltransferase